MEGVQPIPAWRRGLNALADFLLPPLCLSCRAAIHSNTGVCPECWRDIDFIQPPVCERLGIPLPYSGDGPLVSAAALADPPLYERARAVARYDGVMRQLVHGLKYRDRHEGVALFGRWLHQAGEDLFAGADMIISVPLYRSRLWRRRFNQSALLGQRVSALTDIPHDPFALVRTRPTASQVGLSAEQRRRNVTGAFAVPEGKRRVVDGKAILLIDDVITTGATANACARALMRAGAARTDVLALARVVDPLAPAP